MAADLFRQLLWPHPHCRTVLFSLAHIAVHGVRLVVVVNVFLVFVCQNNTNEHETGAAGGVSTKVDASFLSGQEVVDSTGDGQQQSSPTGAGGFC